jgi:hypothetical protein
MTMHSKAEPGEIMIGAGCETIAAARHMTAEQLLHLGTRRVVYLKSGTRDDEPAFMLYGADGTALVIVDTVETAIEMVAEHGLSFVAVH